MSYKLGWTLEGYGISLEDLIKKDVIDIKKFINIHGLEDDLYSDFTIDSFKSMEEFYNKYVTEIKNTVSDGGIHLSCQCELTPYNIYYLLPYNKPWEKPKAQIKTEDDARHFIFNSIRNFLKENVKIVDIYECFNDIKDGWEE